MEGKRTRGRRRVGTIDDLRDGNIEEEGTRLSWLKELDTRNLPDDRTLLID